MKFACEQCKTQYLISDEKIGTRGVRVRCKRCSNVIVLKPDGTTSSLPEQSQVSESNEENTVEKSEKSDKDKDELGQVFDKLFKGGEDDDDDSDWDINGSDVTQLFDPEDLKKLHSQIEVDEESQKIDLVFADAESTNVSPQQLNRQKQDSREWYIVAEGRQQGPLTLQELDRMMVESRINTGDYVWRPGLSDWVPMQEVAELKHLFSERAGETNNGFESTLTEEFVSQERLQSGWSGSPEESSLADLVQKELETVKESVKVEQDQESVSDDSFESGPFQIEGPWADNEEKGQKSGFFDSTIEQTTSYSIDDDGVKVDGFLDRQLARPAYLSEGGRGRTIKRCLIAGTVFIFLVVASAAVYRFGLDGELPFNLFEKQNVIYPKNSGISPQKNRSDQKVVGKIDNDSKNQIKSEKASQGKIADSTKPEKEPQKTKESIKNNDLPETARVQTKKASKETQKKPKQSIVKKASISNKEKHTESPKKNRVAKLNKDKPTKKYANEGSKSKGRKREDGLSKGKIYDVMKKSIPAMKGCVKQQLQRDPSVKGTLLVSFVINPSGRVASATTLSKEHIGTYVSECISYIVKEMEFPQFDGDPITVPRVPLTLGH